MPTTSRPRISPFTSSTASRTASTAASTARAWSSAAAPAAVRLAERPDLSMRVAPRSCSSCRIWALTPDWLICTRSAARVKFASSATAMKYSSCLSSISRDSSYEKNDLLDFSREDGQADSAGTSTLNGRTPVPDNERALKPEDLTRLFVERANDRDAAGIAALYEEQAVMAYPPGSQTVGRDAIRSLWEKVLASAPRFAPEPPLPTRS